jgi:starch-binding outer membrane protein, SusD/RagB family
MKKQILALLSIVLLTSSCENWFNVTSDSETREKDQYSTDAGFQQSLTGCYIGMTDESLYGKNLSWYATELLANQFKPITQNSTTETDYELENYKFSTIEAVGVTEAIWAKAYNVIINANEELIYLNKDSANINPINYHIIKGELLAIRAYMHFDLLRLYGYGNWANRTSTLDSKYTIPYVTGVSKNVAPQLTGKETIDKILSDLDESAKQLKDYDPITGKHDASYYSEVNDDGYYKNRTIHLNYYAVKALQARVYLWRGSADDKAKALTAAEEVIAAVGNDISNSSMNTYLHFLDALSVDKTNTSLACENIFGLNVATLSNYITSYIKPNYADVDYSAMFLSPDDATSLYENSTSDIRFSKLLNQSTSNSSLGYVPLKVYQNNLSKYYAAKISMIRLPEVYYIAAECYATDTNPNLDMAMKMLNTVRQQRGLYSDLSGLTADQIEEEIKKEYRKEFISEGVIFYYYKRTGAISIPNYSGQMSDTQYVLPYPEFELQSGRQQ